MCYAIGFTVSIAYLSQGNKKLKSLFTSLKILFIRFTLRQITKEHSDQKPCAGPLHVYGKLLLPCWTVEHCWIIYHYLQILYRLLVSCQVNWLNKIKQSCLFSLIHCTLKLKNKLCMIASSDSSVFWISFEHLSLTLTPSFFFSLLFLMEQFYFHLKGNFSIFQPGPYFPIFLCLSD